PNYFDVLRIKLLKGRVMSPQASRDEIGEAVVNTRFAKMFGGADSVLGRIVHQTAPRTTNAYLLAAHGHTAYRIVGIVDDVRSTWVWVPGSEGIYVDLTGRAASELAVVARTSNVARTTRLMQQAIPQAVPESPQVLPEHLTTIVWRAEAER